MLHTDWLACTLDNMKLGDCTALYNYFDDCSFSEFRINADSLGLSFGLTLNDLRDTGLIFLGHDEQKPLDNEIVDQFLDEFARRHWALHVLIVSLNFSRVEPMEGWSLVFNHIKETIVEGGSKLDDVIFVLHVAERLALVARLPFLPVIAAHDDLLEIIVDEQRATTEVRALNILRAGLLTLIRSMQERLLEGALPLQDFSAEELVTLELNFLEKPEIDPSSYIELMMRSVAGPSAPLRMLGGRPGSWYEIIQSTVLTALAIYTTLFLVEGSLIKLLLIKARIAQLRAPKLPKKFLEQANDPRQVFPRELLKVVSVLYDGFSHSLVPLPNEKQGLTAKKLREIAVKPLDD